jgi:4'-phosphopantetheinyl transferase
VSSAQLLAASSKLDSDQAELELHLLRVADVELAALDTSALDAEERTRAAAFAAASDRNGFVAAHLLLRGLLGARLASAPNELRFIREPCPLCGEAHGRPALLGAPAEFSLSRASGLVLIAIAPGPVGVDIEAHAQPETASEVARLLHPAERAEIAAAPPSQRAALFTRIWTRKEAYLKALGSGITDDLAADYLGLAQPSALPPGWNVLEVPVGPGFAAAVAHWTGSSDAGERQGVRGRAQGRKESLDIH